MSHKEEILARLHAMGIPHEVYRHEAAHTMEDCMRLPFASPETAICKNILLCNRQQTVFWLFVTPHDVPFRTAQVSKLLGCSRLSFAPPEALTRLLETESGSLSPFGLWYDREHLVALALDDRIWRTPRIAFHPCDNTATVVFTREDFRDRVLPGLGVTPVVISPEETAETGEG